MLKVPFDFSAFFNSHASQESVFLMGTIKCYLVAYLLTQKYIFSPFTRYCRSSVVFLLQALYVCCQCPSSLTYPIERVIYTYFHERNSVYRITAIRPFPLQHHQIPNLSIDIQGMTLLNFLVHILKLIMGSYFHNIAPTYSKYICQFFQ